MGWLTNKIDEYKELKKIEKEAYEKELENVKVENKEYAKEIGRKKAQKKSSAKAHADKVANAKKRGKIAAHRNNNIDNTDVNKERIQRINDAWKF